MMRLPRFLPSVVIACSTVALPVFSNNAFAQDAAAPDTAAPATPAKPADENKALRDDVDSFWHYAKTFNYDLANTAAKKILDAKPEPVTLLKAFQAVSEDRKDNLDQWMLRWQQVPQLRDSVDQLLAVLNQGNSAQRADLKIIDQNIQHLLGTEQSYSIAINRLRDSGELAVAPMIDYLRDPSKKQYYAVIQRAFIDMGHSALSPLVASLDMPANERNLNALLTVIASLGQMRYDVAQPALANLVQSPDSPAVVKQAAAQALTTMGAGDAKNMNVAGLYYEIGLKYFYNKAATSPDGHSKVAFLWSWDDSLGLTKKDVPAAIYGDLMALRSAQKSLKLDSKREEALALWLSADYGREVHLPAGAADPTVSADQPKAHYYGVTAGAKYLNMVIIRALGDHDTAIALAAVKSLQQIAGQSNLFAGAQSAAVVSAMQYPDRIVRFEAAFAAAAALPQTAFEGQERVVPILSEAVAQTGKPYVVVVAAEDVLNARVQQLKDAGYSAAGSATADAATSVQLPAVDVIVVSDDDPAQVTKMQQLHAQLPKFQGASLVIVTKTAASPFVVAGATDPLTTVTQASTVEGLKSAIEDARKKAGAVPMDEKAATDYALRATQLLGKLASSRGQVLDLTLAQDALLQAQNDSRTDLVIAAGNALALLNTKPAQQSLLLKAVDSKTDEKVKLSAYNNLTVSARFFGNMLEADQVKSLQDAVASEQNLDVRNAAAEAHGALNLPADEVKSLLLK